jgi:serine/threonine-protein kinase
VNALATRLQETLGDAFRIERELGGGAMARVFVAEEVALKRRIVVKVLPVELAARVSIERFRREIRISAMLQHPQVVPVLAVGEVDGLPFYTMPFVQSTSLRAQLAEHGRLPLPQVINILRDVARALAYAHEHGVIHRDIKPGNILIAGDSALVADFGLAKAISDSSLPPDDLSGSQSGVGTRAYLSPEQVRSPSATDHRSDLYAFGVLAYELLTGSPAIPRDESHAPIGLPDPLQRRRPDVPPRLAALITKCLALAAADRPQSAAAILRVLDTLAPRGWALVRWSIASAWRTRRTTIVATVVLLTGAVGALAMRDRRIRSESPTSVVVLPPVTTSGSRDDAYFDAGVADALSTALARIPGLRVTPPASASALRGGGDVDYRTAAKELGVESMLGLTVRRGEGRVRIHAQLISTVDGHLIFADDFESAAPDLFRVQEQVATAVVDAMRMRVTSTAAPLVRRPTADLDAYDLYLRGRYVWQHDDQRKAIDYFSQAIAHDSTFSTAWAGLADALYLSAAHDFAPSAEVLPRAKAAATRALALDPTLADAHVSLANIARWWDYDRATAERLYQRALAIDPSYPEAHLSYGWFLMDRGAVDSALVEAGRAVALDPLSQRTRSDYGHLLLLAGRTDSALVQFRRLVEFDSTNGTAQMLLARALLAAGRQREADAAFTRSGISGIRLAVERARWSGGRFPADSARRALAALRDGRPAAYLPPFSVAVLEVRADQPDRALDALERGLADHTLPPELRMLPEFAALRDTPRFQGLLRRMGVAP